MIHIIVVQMWDISYFKAIKELVQPSHFCQVLCHLIPVAVIFFLHFLRYELRVSPEKESSNTELFD
jgi:hypothetical protein